MVATSKKDVYIIDKTDAKINRKFKFEEEVRAAYCLEQGKYLLLIFNRGQIGLFKLFSL